VYESYCPSSLFVGLVGGWNAGPTIFTVQYSTVLTSLLSKKTVATTLLLLDSRKERLDFKQRSSKR
jgi:hypothetical protein